MRKREKINSLSIFEGLYLLFRQNFCRFILEDSKKIKNKKKLNFIKTFIEDIP